MSNNNLEHFQQKFDRINRQETKKAKHSKVFWVKFFDWQNDFFVEEKHRLRIK
jgi:hypothetical protein